MREFHHFCPINVRYSDIDAQGHVNNTRFATYIESGRLAYVEELGLWDGKDFKDLGLIVADIHIAYIHPIQLGQLVKVATRVSHIGNKSIKFAFHIIDSNTETVLATAETINVGYNYRTEQSCPISPIWRTTINEFEGTSF